eukprot:gene50787-44402_t
MPALLGHTNIFRLTGDMLHLLSVFIILHKMLKTPHVRRSVVEVAICVRRWDHNGHPVCE